MTQIDLETETFEFASIPIFPLKASNIQENKEIWVDRNGDLIATLDSGIEDYHEYVLNLGIDTDFELIWNFIAHANGSKLVDYPIDIRDFKKQLPKMSKTEFDEFFDALFTEYYERLQRLRDGD